MCITEAKRGLNILKTDPWKGQLSSMQRVNLNESDSLVILWQYMYKIAWWFCLRFTKWNNGSCMLIQNNRVTSELQGWITRFKSEAVGGVSQFSDDLTTATGRRECAACLALPNTAVWGTGHISAAKRCLNWSLLGMLCERRRFLIGIWRVLLRTLVY